MSPPRDLSAASEARRPAWELLQRRPQEVVQRLGILSSELEARIEREEDLLGALAPVWQRAEPMIEALALGDMERFQSLSPLLVGLGAGSTPAGDDYLVGAFHALWSRADADWLAGPAEAFADHTTRESAAWLLAAARGEAAPAWRDLIEALGAGHGGEAVRRAARRLARRLHRSGGVPLRLRRCAVHHRAPCAAPLAGTRPAGLGEGLRRR